MLVFWDQRLALLATPKTGSTAIAAALEPLAAVSIQRPREIKHTHVYRFQTYFAPFLKVSSGADFAVAALMREPRDWLGSWYRYRQRDTVQPATSTVGISFDDFVQAYCSAEPPEFAAVGSQARFLQDGKGVDHLFRYEAIDTFVAFLEQLFGCEIILPRLNVSPQAPTGLSDTTEALLRRFAARDFALYATLTD